MKQLTISAKVTNRENQSFVQYLREVSEIKVLTPAEEIQLTLKTATGDKAAIDELVRRNLRFVVSVAKQYATPQNPLEDLVNEGNIGLMIAAERFDPSTGFKFISFAVWWIRKIIMEHLTKHGKLIRLPSNKINTINKLERQLNKLEQKLGRPVSIHEAIDDYGIDLSVIGNDIDLKSSTEQEFINMLSTFNLDSLDRSLSSDFDNSSSLGDTIVDDTFVASDQLLINADIKAGLDEVMDALKPRDKKIMIGLFGLDGGIPRTLKDIGDEMGISREMVRQIREKSLLKLKKRLKGNEILG